jgi:hypothetical protein
LNKKIKHKTHKFIKKKIIVTKSDKFIKKKSHTSHYKLTKDNNTLSKLKKNIKTSKINIKKIKKLLT